MSNILEKYRTLKNIVAVKEQNIQSLKQLCYGMYQSPGNMTEKVKASTSDKEVKQLVRIEEIIDLELRLKKDKAKLIRLYTRIDAILGLMQNSLYEILIREYDLNDLDFEEICEKYHYSKEYMQNNHSKALKEFHYFANRKKKRVSR